MVSDLTTSNDVLNYAAGQARLAPSVHNSQPWRFVMTDDSLEIHADRDRQLAVLDPTGRQLLISCGCALLNARTAVAARGYQPIVERFPDSARPDLVARLRLPQQQPRWVALGALDQFVPRRRTSRTPYLDEVIPPPVIDDLIRTAAAEGGVMTELRHREHRAAAADLSRHAAELEDAEPAYREELRRWTSTDPQRADGILTVPAGSAGALVEAVASFRLLPQANGSQSPDPCLLVLATPGDDRAGWLRAGEALERVWLEATQLGYVASLFTQVIEIPHTRQRLRAALGLPQPPHVLLRVGRAAAPPASNRRPLAELLTCR